MADTRVFRLTYDSGKVKIGARSMAGPAIAYTKKHHGKWSYRLGSVIKVEVTDPDSTVGWQDVTAEFLGGNDGGEEATAGR